MNRRETMVALVVLGAVPVRAGAQQATKTARIGYMASDLVRGPPLREAFIQGLRDLGYIEGRNVVLEYRDAEGKVERLPALATELVALKVDVIFAPGTQHVSAAKEATKTIPIVFADVADPVARGFVASLARPGGNITGVSNLAPDLVGKGLELIKQAVPGVNHVAFLWQPGYLPQRAQEDIVKRAETAAGALAMRLQFVEARGPEDFDKAFAEMTKARVGALFVWGSIAFILQRNRLVELAAKNRLPGIYPFGPFVDAGGLMSYAPNVADNFRRAAVYVDKILKGAQVADLPVEQSTKFELVINLKTAKTLGLTIPQALLQRADRVIE
jgi:putative tryptophan/tyrosine transport system substrate-binding protein